jgi:hypothetical protein
MFSLVAPKHMDLIEARFDGDDIGNRHVPRHAFVIDIEAQRFGNLGRSFCDLLREVGKR